MKEDRYAVTGMSCAACSAHVQRAVSKVGGVDSAEVNLATETLQVEYDESAINIQAIHKAVNDLGFKTIPETTDEKRLEKELRPRIGGRSNERQIHSTLQRGHGTLGEMEMSVRLRRLRFQLLLSSPYPHT